MNDKMTWEETIQMIRNDPKYSFLVEKAYFGENLPINVERFLESEEFIETLKILKVNAPNAKKLLDVGSGNGIAAIAFAMNGYNVVATEPDPSKTIGAGAILSLKEHYKLDNIEVVKEYAENLGYNDETFDVVYVRQAMHHAYDLNLFIKNLSRLLKKGGLLFTVRDHVVFNDQDREWFLESHPLHKYYGGENAFTTEQYLNAFNKADLEVKTILKHYDSVINYFPMTVKEFENYPKNYELKLKERLVNRFGLLGRIRPFQVLYKWKNGFYNKSFLNEKNVPGRIYSFITIKN